MQAEIKKIFTETAELHMQLCSIAPGLASMLEDIIKLMRSGATLYAMGNGGSAADSQHIAGELVGRFKKERKALPCIALNVDNSIITAVANDYGAEHIFARQVEAHVKPGDIVLGISTSGNSGNILKALEISRSAGALNIGLSGKDGGSMAELCDHLICVPCRETPRIQEAHQTIIHIMCELIEKELFKNTQQISQT